MLGPGLDVRGGVSRCESLIVECLRDHRPIRHIATACDGSIAAKIACFARAVPDVRDALGKPGPLVVHIHFASRGSTLRKMILAAMVLSAGKTLLLHAHGGGFDTFFAGLPGWLQNRIRRLLQQSPRFLVLSDTWKSFYEITCQVDSRRIEVMRNPVKLPETTTVRAGRAHVGFVYLGRISPAKGTFDLLEAFSRLPEAVRQTSRLVIAGDGEVERARQDVSRLGLSDLVTVHAWVDDETRDELIRDADVFVLPSYREGVPMSMLETMADGVPAIGTLVGGVPEVLKPGVNGLAVEPGDVDGLCDALRQMNSDAELRQRLGKAARETARDFDVHAYCARLEELYDIVARETEAAAA